MQTDTAGNLIKYVKCISRKQFNKNNLSLNDLLQEAWCIKLKCEQNYDAKYGIPYEKYERISIYRHLIRLLQRSHKKQTVQCNEVPDKVDPGLSPGDLSLARELLGRLSKSERYIIEERYFKGKTFVEIGKRLGQTRQAIKIIHDRILGTIRSWLNA